MKKVIATLLMLCLVTVVVPPIPENDSDDDAGISTYAYSCQYNNN